MATRGIDRFMHESVRLLLGIATMAGFLLPPAMAQQTKQANKPDSVFDDEKKPATPATPKAAAPSDRDTIGFTQENVAAQMTELEERMFRLSEALRGLEPENASRLRLALKFSREEQILEQMRETHKLLEGRPAQQGRDRGPRARSRSSSTSATCCWPRTSTSSSSWRGSARCARRSASSSGSSRKRGASSAGRASPSSSGRRLGAARSPASPDLESLVRDQKAVIADTKATAAKATIRRSERPARPSATARSNVRKAAAALATDPLFADLQPPHLRRADAHLADAVSSAARQDRRRRGRRRGGEGPRHRSAKS